MGRRQVFLSAAWSERWKESYAALAAERQASCDRVAIALIKRKSPPGLRIKPIQPEKYYFEARISSGDRIIFRVEAETIYFVDVVKHDDIERYGRRPRKKRCSTGTTSRRRKRPVRRFAQPFGASGPRTATEQLRFESGRRRSKGAWQRK